MALLLLPLVLAGCASGPDADVADEGDGCGAELSGIPASLRPGEPIPYRLDAACPDRDFSSPRAALLFHDQPVAEASREAYSGSCGDVPFRTGAPAQGPCAFPDPGTFYLRGFVELPLEGGGTRTMFTPEYVAVVQPGATEPRVRLLDLPSRVAVGQPLELGVEVVGLQATTEHVGAHWASSSQAAREPDTSAYPKACDHVTDLVQTPGVFRTRCTFDGPAFIRAHLRYEDEAGTVRNLWGDEHQVRLG